MEGKNCRNPEPTAVTRGCNRILGQTVQTKQLSENVGAQEDLVADHKEDVFRRRANLQSGFHAAAHGRSHTGAPVFINRDDHSETIEGATYPMGFKTKYYNDRLTTGLVGNSHRAP